MTLGNAAAVQKTRRVSPSPSDVAKSHAPAPRETVKVVSAEGAPFGSLFELLPLALERRVAAEEFPGQARSIGRAEIFISGRRVPFRLSHNRPPSARAGRRHWV